MTMIFLAWIVLISVTWFKMSSELIFITSCPKPCTCSSYLIDCGNKHLSHVPTFTRPNERTPYFYLSLDMNQLTVIPAYAFQNLSSVNASSIYINLQTNHIHSIEIHAFSGIETAVTDLNLVNNNLRHFPAALEELSSLTSLQLSGNPLFNLDGMVNISSKLKTFSVSLDMFTCFPDELRHISNLSSLTVNGIKFPILHSTVFNTYKNSLTSLEMSYANFESIPAAFCRLNVLQSFTSNYSPKLGKYNSSIFDQCSHRMTTVTHLTLQNDQLTILPKFSSVFPNLNFLDLDGNSLHFIDSSSLAGLTNLIQLFISYNRFTNIPSAVNSAANLVAIRANGNQIDTVEDFDLLHLHKLRILELDTNPLVYISPHAFTYSPLLYFVNIDNTLLGHIPRAFLRLRHLHYVFLSGKPIECSCHAMSYLKRWNVTSAYIFATCSSGISVKSYLTIHLPKCP